MADEFQHKGIGRHLMTLLELIAHKQKMLHIQLLTQKARWRKKAEHERRKRKRKRKKKRKKKEEEKAEEEEKKNEGVEY